jgi:arginyl-tRNA synthetase
MNVAINFNDFYREHPVLKAESEVRMHRLAIVDATRIVLRNGLELLGIKALEKM